MRQSFLTLLLSTAVLFTSETCLLASELQKEEKKVFLKGSSSMTNSSSQAKGKEKVEDDTQQEGQEDAVTVKPDSAAGLLETKSLSLASSHLDDPQISSSSSASETVGDFFANFPNELKPFLVAYLSLKDLNALFQVSNAGKSFDNSLTWHTVAQRFVTDRPALKHTREDVMRHYLRVRMNLTLDPAVIQQIKDKYQHLELHKNLPFQEWRNCSLVWGNLILALRFGQKVDRYIDRLAEQGDELAIAKKIDGLSYGLYGYKKNSEAAAQLIHQFDEQDDDVQLLIVAENGNGLDHEDAVKFNNDLVDQGNIEAIKRKSIGLSNGVYDYQRDLQAALEFDKNVTEKVIDGWQIIRHIPFTTKPREREVLSKRYQASWIKLKELTSLFPDKEKHEFFSLIEKASSKTCNSFVIGELRNFLSNLSNELSPLSTRARVELILNCSMLSKYQLGMETILMLLIKQAEEKGQAWAYYLKAEGLKYSIQGFKPDLKAARDYISNHNIPY
ncbi:MAG: hypothetical protein BGO77_08045 [Caedibacter sp. 37-49]|nr:MAG: hypothetical protein BGO77_08045 [Caedibacter sp. 37-49]